MDKDEFKQRPEELRKDALDKFGEYLKAENELVMESKFSQSGFIDKSLIEKVNTKKVQWQAASNLHLDFIRYGDRFGLF